MLYVYPYLFVASSVLISLMQVSIHKFLKSRSTALSSQCRALFPKLEELAVLKNSLILVSPLLDGNPTRTTVESRSVRLGTGVAISLRQSALIT